MKNKMLLRIMGALSSALIVVAVFVPWISTVGFSQSLWDLNQSSLYLPIMIIAFGGLGILLFSLNLKTEFVYMSTGAVLFQVIIESINMINQGKFGLFGLGYYFLLAGGLLTGIITFAVNLKPKAVKEIKVVEDNDNSDVNKVDNLYSNQVEEDLKPIDIQIEQIKPVDEIIDNKVDNLEPSIKPNSINNTQVLHDYTKVNTTVNQAGLMNHQNVQPNNINSQNIEHVALNQNGLMNHQFSNSNINPQQMRQPVVNSPRPDFDVQRVNNNISQNSTPVNPVVQDFVRTLNVDQNNKNASPLNQGVYGTNNTSVNNNSNNTVSQTDIFGQQINK